MRRGRMLLWAILIPVCYAPSFVLGSHPGPAGLITLALAFAFALLVVALAVRPAELDRIARAIEGLAAPILLGAIAVYVGFSVAVALQRIAHFEHAPMLGLFSQSTWSVLHGLPFANTQESIDGTPGSHFAIHFSPTLLVLTPFYALFPHPAVLIVAQALAVALAIVPLYHLLRDEVPRAAALVSSVTLLAVPIFAWGAARDFHDSSFLPVLLLASLWALDHRRWGWFTLFAVAALGVREDVGLVLAALALYAFLRGHGLRVAVPILALGLLWFVLATKLVMPRFASAGMIIDPHRFFVAMFGQWGDTPLHALGGMLAHPVAVVHWLLRKESVRYGYLLLRPLLLFPPFGNAVMLAALPGLAINLLSGYAFMRAPDLPYSMIPLTFFSVAAMRVATRVSPRTPTTRRAATSLAMALIVLAGCLPSTVLSIPSREPNLPPRAAAAAAVKVVPEVAAVYAPLALYPALCNREDFDDWESTGPLMKDAAFRKRYPVIILWPDGDPPGESRDRALADLLKHDSGFVARPGFEPLLVYERR